MAGYPITAPVIISHLLSRSTTWLGSRDTMRNPSCPSAPPTPPLKVPKVAAPRLGGSVPSRTYSVIGRNAMQQTAARNSVPTFPDIWGPLQRCRGRPSLSLIVETQVLVLSVCIRHVYGLRTQNLGTSKTVPDSPHLRNYQPSLGQPVAHVTIGRLQSLTSTPLS